MKEFFKVSMVKKMRFVKRRVLFSMILLLLLFLMPGTPSPQPQEKDIWENLKLDFNLPSQELYNEAFQDSVPAVVWLEWSPYAFAKAIALDKPILLNIGVPWDKNCHRMNTEIFSDPSVALILNNFFIPIKVDGDERPDIRKAYGARIWPSVFFLLPDGRPLIWQKEGGEKMPLAMGYVTPDVMKSIALESFKYYRGNSKKAVDLAKSQMETETKLLRMKPGVFSGEIPEKISSTLKADFDLQHGGFGKEPKFPMPSAVELALQKFSMDGNQAFFELASRTLRSIMNSEIYDTIDGGIFRISAKADWTGPAHEKLLDRNALLLSNLIDAYMLSGREEFQENADQILSYIEKNLAAKEGGFYAGQSADFGYAEGYYSSSPEERKYSVTPLIDKRVFCDWNCATVSSFIKASIFLNNPALLEKAQKAADFILEKLYYPGRGAFHYFSRGEAKLIGLLEDNALLCQMLVDLYQMTGDVSYLERAQDTADFIIDNLKDVVQGGYFDSIQSAEAQGKLRLPIKSIDNNALTARIMIRLYYLTGKEKYLREATKTLELFSGSYLNYGVAAASYGLACSEFFEQPLKVVIIGKAEESGMKAFMREANRISEKWKIIKFIDETKEDISKISFVQAATPVLYFIQKSVISAPVTDPGKVLAQLEKFKKSLMQVKERKEKSR